MSAPSTLAIRALAEPIRSLAFGSISGSYAGIGLGLSYPSRILYVTNLTNATLMFSLDGVNDHFVLPADAFILLDWNSNKSTNASGFFLSEGQRIYVKLLGSPSSGSVYVSSFYGATL